jgi:GNAT superfamily N-acetyltransferase
MNVSLHTNAEAFAQLVRPLLLQNEAAHCSPLAILDTLINDPTRYARALLFSVEEATEIVAMAWMTPPHPLGFTAMPSEGVERLAEFCATLEDEVPSVVGPRPAVDEFKDRWLRKTGASLASSMTQGIYQLTEVTPPRGVPGAMRFAAESDRELLAEWTHCFAVDCGLPSSREQAEVSVQACLRHGSRVFWEHEGCPVSMAGFGGRTPSGMRVSHVYTPPEYRGKGYASAVVGTLSQHLLDRGHQFCFLYTDLSNPTSNRIYQRLGYRFVCESALHTFGPASRS